MAPDRSVRAPVVPGRILLVDDEPLLLRSLARVLRADQHEIRLAGSLPEALPHLADPELDLVLLDLFLHCLLYTSDAADE